MIVIIFFPVSSSPNFVPSNNLYFHHHLEINMSDKHFIRLPECTKKNHFIYTNHAFTHSMPTFNPSDGALDTLAN